MKKLKKSSGRKVLPQQSAIANKLMALAPNVTAADRTNACRALGISKPTMSVYLNGNGPNNDLGLELINVLQRYINNRAKKINSLCEA